jgi:hypothetical protein
VAPVAAGGAGPEPVEEPSGTGSKVPGTVNRMIVIMVHG